MTRQSPTDGGSTAETSPSQDGRDPFSRRSIGLLHIFGLAGFAFGQPVLDVFGRSPETFVDLGTGTVAIVSFAMLVILGPALLIWLAMQPARLMSSDRRNLLLSAVVWLLCIVIALQILKSTTSLLGPPLAGAAVLAGSGLAAFLLATSFGRLWLDLSWIGPVAFLVLFLFVSPVSKLVRPVAAAPDEPGRARSIPLVMVIFDELPLMSILDRNGEINETLYPNFARLARDATWFRNYTVTEVRSEYSIPTILSGQVVKERPKYPVLADYPQNLFVLLEPTHRINAIEWTTVMCPPTACTDRAGESTLDTLTALTGDAVGVWKDRTMPTAVTRDILEQFGDDPIADEQEILEALEGRPAYQPEDFHEFLEGITAEGPATFHFLHARPPHTPWIYYPSGSRYVSMKRPADPATNPTVWLDDEWAVELHRLRHHLAVKYVDRLVGDLLERLKDVDLYDEALVVVTSDHGVSFVPGGPVRALTEENLHEVPWVPLLVKKPGQERGEVDDRNLSAPDLLPTIADALGFEVPWATDGSSALDPKWDRGPSKELTMHRDPPQYPWPDRDFSIDIESAERRLREGAFEPADRSLPPKLWLYSVGPAPHLVGRDVADLPAGPPAPHAVEVVDPEAYDEVSLAGELPGLVNGTVDSEEVGVVVAALNGRVAGASTIFDDREGENRFAVMVPDFYFREGSNDLQLFQLDGGRLRPMELDA